MPQIYQLPLISEASPGDQIPVYQPQNGDTRRLPMSALVDFVEQTQETSAERIQFLQAGTGAQVRSVQSKLRDVVSVKDFGAVGDGIADDTAAIQAAVNYASTIGANVFFTSGIYKITSGITIKCIGDLPTPSPGSGIHFSPSNPVGLFSDSQAVIKAFSVMSFMVKYTFDATDSDIAPFYSFVEGMSFDGNNNANDCVYIDYSMHMSVEKCRFWNYLASGIHNFGYGVAQYRDNVFRGPKGIFIERGGDSLIEHNDLFIPSGGIGIDCGYFSGNTTIFANVFTRNDTGVTYGVRLSGDYALSASEEVRHVVVSANEFCALNAGIYSQAYGTNDRNVYQCLIANNHVNPDATTNIGCLADLNSSQNIIISNNWINKIGFNATTGDYGVRLYNCVACLVSSNIFEGLEKEAIRLDDCQQCVVESNTFNDCGKAGTSYPIIQIFNNTQHSLIQNNYFYCSDNLNFGQYGVYENSGPNNNTAKNNKFFNFSQPYVKSGANSWFWRQENGISIPASGRYNAGDVIVNTSLSILGSPGSQYIIGSWQRITSGTNNVLNTDWVECRTLTGT